MQAYGIRQTLLEIGERRQSLLINRQSDNIPQSFHTLSPFLHENDKIKTTIHMKENYKYDVAISFAEEDRNIALALALALELAGIKKVYYYPKNYEATWGQDLETTLTSIYQNEAKYAVVLLSKDYFRKPFARIELASIRSRMKTDIGIVCMLPVLVTDLDMTDAPDLLIKGYLKWQYNPKEIAATLSNLLGKPYSNREDNEMRNGIETKEIKAHKKVENYVSNNVTGNSGSNTNTGNSVTINN